ncbi:hypothetical protein HYT91_01480 [Candidatus Pacearchaeota archaeon]|nr:hypothetical protein [Candidatus Pacearchaeota archaeon]
MFIQCLNFINLIVQKDIKKYEGKDCTLRDYWEKEIKSFKKKKEEQERKLKK